MKKSSMIKILSVTVAVLMILGCLVGCGNSSKPTPDTGKTTKETATTTTTGESTDPTEPSETENTDPTAPEDVTTTTKPRSTTKRTTTSTTKKTGRTTDPTYDASAIIKLPAGKKFEADQTCLYGIGYVEDQMNNRVSVDQAVYLLRSIGCRSCRIWATCYSDSHTLVDWHVKLLHELAQKLKAANIQVIFITYWWESPEYPGMSTFIPRRNTTAGSNYMTMLQNYEDLCYMMTKEFPEVDCWELGNEWNHTGAINPSDYRADGTGGEAFTLKEKADISTDLMYRCVKAARAAGSKSRIIMPAMAPADGMDGIAMTDYLEYVYKNIESGKFGSKNPRDYFDALAWHPYMWDSCPDMEWVKNNNRIYQIAIDHGDAGIPVFLTEYGYSDNGNNSADTVHGEWMVTAYDLIRKYMPYVETMHYYRMFTDTSRANDYYGLMNQPEDGFGPKKKGLAFQKMAGGKGNLWNFYLPLDEEDED